MWSEAETVALLQLYKKQLPDFRHKGRAWQQISDGLKKLGINVRSILCFILISAFIDPPFFYFFCSIIFFNNFYFCLNIEGFYLKFTGDRDSMQQQVENFDAKLQKAQRGGYARKKREKVLVR